MLKKIFLFIALVFLSAAIVQAQVTTSSITGNVTDASSTALPGATISATHTPTGTVYNSTSNKEGIYSMSGLRVGGPYTIIVSHVGYQQQTINNITLQLGETFQLNIVLGKGNENLENVTVSGTARRGLGLKTGASTVVGLKQINEMPSLSRSLGDFTRLTPQATGSGFVGTNNRFNNITIDGAVNNDVFGLAGTGGLPGGQANTQPISLDAIQEIQVVLAPYDVKFGNFTGGGVNAVTKSGTNTFKGTAYFFGRNQNTVGKNVLTNAKNSDFSNNQFGLSLGGPIIKNKLFFFANADLQRIVAPLANNAGEAGSAITAETAKRIADFAQSKYGYDVGSIGPVDAQTQNNKIFTKIDWNINSRNQLAVRYNYIDAFDDNINRTSTFFRFGNNAYKFVNKQHVAVAELRSKFSDNVSNNLIVGYSSIRDKRTTAGALFPQITILNLDGDPTKSAELGSQRSSVANELDQDIFEFTDNLKVNLGQHNLTIGTHNEFFKFRNLFINNLNGRWDYNSVEDFLNEKPNRVRATYSRVPGNPAPDASFSAAQLSAYVQDEYSPISNLKLTLGLRVDLPVFPDTPGANDSISKYFPGYRTDRTPSKSPLFSPRVGFNWDIANDRTFIARGGTGIFTGRVPFVWLSNQFSNDGLMFGTVDRTNSATSPLPFVADPNNQQSAGSGSNRAEVNLVSDNFKIPQVWRSNLAFDIRLPLDVLLTLEGIYSKTLNNVVYSNLNVTENGTIATTLSNGADLRPRWNGRVSNPNFTGVVLLDNSNKGYTYSLTGQLQKTFDFGLSAMFAYTYGQARSVNDGASSTALSNWEFVQVVSNPNNPALTISNYELRNRLVGSLNYGVRYGKDKLFGTSISLFYSGNSGSPYTYLYNGDLNGDGAFNNDLLFVPAKREDIALKTLTVRSGTPSARTFTPDEQWTALNAFIDNDPYLSKKRGQYTDRNGAKTPWEHHFDLRIAQDLGIRVGETKNALQLTFDIFNVGNLFSKKWGHTYFVTNQANTLVTYNTSGTAGFQFSPETSNVGYQTSPFASAWSGQIGIRYNFN